ncbi:flippase [Azospirillum sp.]|uniref:flippase n=1 Tax=Azospirillum sp. TaxID=34012 RepID=UPI003D727AC0
MSAGRLIFLNIRALAIAKVLTMAFGLVATAWTARHLGPEHYGFIGFGTAFIAYAALFVNLGLSTYAVREIARDRSQAKRIVDHVLTIRVLLAVLVGGLYALIVYALDKPFLVKAVLWVQIVQLFGQALIIDFYYQGTERMGVIAGREAGNAIVTMIATLALVRGPDDVVIAAGITALSVLFNALLVVVRYTREFGAPHPRFDLGAWRVMLTAAAPMAVSVFAWAIFSHLDTVMLGFMADKTQVGWYAASFKVLMLASTAGHIVMNSFLPQLASAYGDHERMRLRMHDYATTMLVVGALASAAGLTLAPEILMLFFGEAYAPAVNALRLLMAALGVIYLNMVLGNPLLVWHRQTGYMAVILTGGAINAGLNLWAIPRWGMEGSAAATLASELVCTAGMAWLHRRAVGQLYLGIAARAAACALLAVASWVLIEHLLPQAVPRHPLAVLAVGGTCMAMVYAAAVPLAGLVAVSRLRRLVGASA